MTTDGKFRVVYFSQMADIRSAQETGERLSESLSENVPGAGISEPSLFGRNRSGGVVGVVSLSNETSLRTYNNQKQYDEWVFVYVPSTTEPSVGVTDTGM